jgi:hypothetical protein
MLVIALTLHRAKIDYTDLPEPNEVQGSVTETLNTRHNRHFGLLLAASPGTGGKTPMSVVAINLLATEFYI